MAPARRRTCSRVPLSLAVDAGRVEAIGSLRQKLIDVLLQDGLQQMGFDAEFGGNDCQCSKITFKVYGSSDQCANETVWSI